MMGKKKGTCGELSRSIQIFLPVDGRAALLTSRAFPSAGCVCTVLVLMGGSSSVRADRQPSGFCRRFDRHWVLGHFCKLYDRLNYAVLLGNAQPRIHRQRKHPIGRAFRHGEIPFLETNGTVRLLEVDGNWIVNARADSRIG